MTRYRKKPVIIEAMQYAFLTPDLLSFLEGSGVYLQWDRLIIPTLEGEMAVSVGDFIIKGVKGEFYPCKPDIFEVTYERINE